MVLVLSSALFALSMVWLLAGLKMERQARLELEKKAGSFEAAGQCLGLPPLLCSLLLKRATTGRRATTTKKGRLEEALWGKRMRTSN